MSKQQLQKAAQESSGVSYEESLLATKLVPSLYERIGKETGFERLSQDFYDRVFADKQAAWFLNIFSSSTKQEAVENQVSVMVRI
jgi:truncated hemoglobin YjbI